MAGANLYQKDYPSFALAQVSQNFAAGIRAFVFTNQVFEGKYWWIPYLHGQDSDATAQGLELFLVDSSVYPPSAAPGGGTVATPQGFLKLAPLTGNAGNSDMTVFQSQASRATLPFFYNGIIVPSGFALVLWESNTAISGAARTLTLRFVYIELENGCSPPIF
jgi:hypothetical protein